MEGKHINMPETTEEESTNLMIAVVFSSMILSWVCLIWMASASSPYKTPPPNPKFTYQLMQDSDRSASWLSKHKEVENRFIAFCRVTGMINQKTRGRGVVCGRLIELGINWDSRKYNIQSINDIPITAD